MLFDTSKSILQMEIYFGNLQDKSLNSTIRVGLMIPSL